MPPETYLIKINGLKSLFQIFITLRRFLAKEKAIKRQYCQFARQLIRPSSLQQTQINIYLIDNIIYFT